MKLDAPVRVLVVNLHATSRPWLVIPWLWALIVRHRVHVVLLQECTDRHARWLRRRSRRWQLIRARGYGEAVYARRRLVELPDVEGPITRGWQGHHVDQLHAGRTLPSCLIDGRLRVYSVHMPPGWLTGPNDRHEAGRDYLTATRPAAGTRVPEHSELWAGDWNADPTSAELRRWRHRRFLTLDDAAGHRIKHAATRRAEVTHTRLLAMGPDGDHRPLLLVVEPL